MPEPSFEEILASQKLFRDKNALSPHFVPMEWNYRDAETKMLMTAVAPALRGQKPKNLFLYGKTGSGKSITTRRVLSKLEDQKNDFVMTNYMNCKTYDSRYKVIQKVISEFDSEFAKTGHSFAVLYEKLLNYLETNKKQLIIVLDEIDVVKDLDTLIYTLTRANDELKSGNVSMIGISNKVNFKQKLETRSKSAICEQEIVFQPYNAEQLRGILSQRVPVAFYDAVVDASALGLAAAIAAGENGDARYALNLLLRGGERADAEKKDKVVDRDVENARKDADQDKAREVIESLPEHQQLVLYSLAVISEDLTYTRLMEDTKGERLYFSGEVFERYETMCKKMGKEPRSARWYREYLRELENLGLVVSTHSGKGVRGQATLLRLAYPAEKVKRAIEANLQY